MKRNGSHDEFHQIRNGFTLIELLAVVSIIAMLSTIVVMGSRKADAQLKLNAQAHELAMLFRGAQSDATNVAVGMYKNNYAETIQTFGIYQNADEKSFKYFIEDSDEPAEIRNFVHSTSGYYDGLADNIFDNNKSITIPSDITIVSSCLIEYQNGFPRAICNMNNNKHFDTNISYTRPNLQAIFYNFKRSGNGLCMPNASIYRIELQSTQFPDQKAFVFVEKSGLVYTQNKDIIDTGDQYGC